MAKKQNILTSFKPQDYSGFVQSTLALEKAKAAAQDPTASFTAFATPILTELDRQAGVVAEAKETFLENMPDDFQVELVSPELKGQLTERLKEYKTEYLEGVDLLSKHANNPNSMEYKRGVEITEGAKNKMMNTYNGLVKLQQDRTFEINNANSRGYNSTANSALADQLVIGLNATQVTYDENGSPIYNSGLEGVDAINVNDYKRTSTLDYDALAKVDNAFNSGAYNLGVKGYDKNQFLIDNENNIERITTNKKLADQLFFMGVSGDPTGSTAVKNRVDQNLLEKDKNGNIIPPSKSMVNMEIMKDLYRTMGENSFDTGALKVQERDSLTPNNLNFAANLSSGNKVIRHPEKKGYYFIQGPDGLYYESFNRGAKVVKEKDGEILVDQKPQNGSSIEDLQNEYGIQVETTTQSSQGDYNYLQEGPDYNRFIQGEMNPNEEYSFALAILGLGGEGTKEELEDKFNKEEIIKKAKEGSDIKPSKETTQNLPKEGEKLDVEKSTSKDKVIVQGVELDKEDWSIYDKFTGSLWSPTRWFRGNPNEDQQKAIKRIQDALTSALSNELDNVL